MFYLHILQFHSNQCTQGHLGCVDPSLCHLVFVCIGFLPFTKEALSTDAFSFSAFNLLAKSGAMSSVIDIFFPFRACLLNSSFILDLFERNFMIVALDLMFLSPLCIGIRPTQWTISISLFPIWTFRLCFANLITSIDFHCAHLVCKRRDCEVVRYPTPALSKKKIQDGGQAGALMAAPVPT